MEPESCPQCAKPILRAGQKFCAYCRFPLAAKDNAPLAPSVSHRELRAIAPPAFDGRTPVPAPRKLRDIYFELGRAFAVQQRLGEALEALERALKEEGAVVPGEIHYEIARAAEAAGDAERAFRAWLAAAAAAPGQLGAVLEYLHARLDEQVGTDLGAWICKEWQPALAAAALEPAQRAAAAIFAGRVHLFLGASPQALECFAEAAALAPGTASALADRFVFGANLPSALATAKDGPAHFLLAQVHQCFGHRAAALEQLEAALTSEFPGANHPLAPVYELQARLFEADGQIEKAAAADYEAGRRFNWRGEQPRAAELLNAAIRLRPAHAPSHWYLADTLRLCPEPERIEEARKVWDAALAHLGLPEPEFAWAYTVRALLNEQSVSSARNSSADARLYCEAIVFLECGLTLSREDSYLWAYLARFFTYVNLERNAVEAASEAKRLEPTNPIALDELTASLTYIGDFAAAEKALEQWMALGKSDSAEAWKGYLLLLTARGTDALACLRASVEREPEVPWYRMLLAQCHERIGQMNEAQAEWEEILRIFQKTHTLGFPPALAAYKLGRWPQARELLERLRAVPVEPPGQASRYLGLAGLAAGDWHAGFKSLEEGIGQTTFPWRLAEFAQFDFAAFKHTGAARTGEQQQLLAAVETKLEAKMQRLREEPGDTLSELTAARSRAGDESSAATAVSASLARLCGERGEWLRAAQLYHELRADAQKRFPEAARALAHALGKFADGMGKMVREGDPATARAAHLEPALALARETHSPMLAPLVAQTAFTHFRENAAALAGLGFTAALAERREADAEGGGRWLGELCRGLLADGASYWALDDLWAALAAAPQTGETPRGELADARAALTAFLPSHLGMPPESASTSGACWLATPLAIEMDSALVPADTEDWVLLKRDIPEMRDRVRDTTGVEVPGVRCRANEGDLPRGAYIIMLHEIPVVMGVVECDRSEADAASAWMRYCPHPVEAVKAAGLEDADIIAGAHPETGRPGCWIAPRCWTQVERHGLVLWPTPLSFMIAHLEAVLRRNLLEFLSVQAVADWLKKAAAEKRELVQRAVPDISARLKLTRVLRLLAQERVPVVDTVAILEKFLATGQGVDAFATMRAIRLLVKAQLPGNEPTTERRAVPAETEAQIAAGICGTGDRRCLALPPEPTQDALVAIRGLVAADKPDLALVVQDAGLRPFLRRLVELEWPSVNVLAAEELVLESAAASSTHV